MSTPMPLTTIVGHKHLVDLLRRAVERGRVPQSLLFAGPDGVGKHAVAVALAQAVNCPRRREGDGRRRRLRRCADVPAHRARAAL